MSGAVIHTRARTHACRTVGSCSSVWGRAFVCLFVLCSKKTVHTGTENGDVYCWEDHKCTKVIKAHKAPIFSICQVTEGLFGTHAWRVVLHAAG